MPEDLYNAHKKLDRMVMRAYNKSWKTESKIVADLMLMYSDMTNN